MTQLTGHPATLIKDLVPGQAQISASEFNSMIQWYRRMRSQLPTGEAGAVVGETGLIQRPRPFVEEWRGVIGNEGRPVDPNDPIYVGIDPADIPAYDEDLAGPMYWVWRADRTDGADSTNLTPPTFSQIDRGQPRHLIVPAYNEAELGSGTHALKTDFSEVVTVRGEWRPRVVNGVVTAPMKHYSFNRSPGGGQIGAGVVIECQYNSTTHTLTVVISPLLSTPYGYDANPTDEEKITAWAAVDPMFRSGMIAFYAPIIPITGDPSITHVAWPNVSVNRANIAPPKRECLTEFGEPCAGDLLPDICGSP